MATRDGRPEIYADRICAAVHRDKRGRTARVMESMGHEETEVASQLNEIGLALDGLIYKDSREPLSDEAKDDIAEQTARKLGLRNPRGLRVVLREASVHNFLAILADIEEILNRVK